MKCLWGKRWSSPTWKGITLSFAEAQNIDVWHGLPFQSKQKKPKLNPARLLHDTWSWKHSVAQLWKSQDGRNCIRYTQIPHLIKAGNHKRVLGCFKSPDLCDTRPEMRDSAMRRQNESHQHHTTKWRKTEIWCEHPVMLNVFFVNMGGMNTKQTLCEYIISQKINGVWLWPGSFSTRFSFSDTLVVWLVGFMSHWERCRSHTTTETAECIFWRAQVRQKIEKHTRGFSLHMA